MKKIVILFLTLSLFTKNTYGIRTYKSLGKFKSTFDMLTAKDKTLEKFAKTISENTNYQLTGVFKPNIAEKVLSKKKEDAIEWFSIIFIYSLLNEVKEQLQLALGKEELDAILNLSKKELVILLNKSLDKYIKDKSLNLQYLSRFLKILLRVHLFIKENGKVGVEDLEKILYKNTGKSGKKSYFTKYIQQLYNNKKIITPSLITCLESEYINFEATIGFVRDIIASLRTGSTCSMF